MIWAGLATPATLAQASATGVAPRSIGELDCNGYSTIQRSVDRALPCTDIRGLTGARFYDNGWYIGHDEPDLRFLSSKAGSGNDVVWNEQLGTDPAAAPTVQSPGHDVTHFTELTLAPWFSMAICDPLSFPQNPCKPNSESNAPSAKYAGGGSAFMELQFYAPGFGPFIDNLNSCDDSHWCAALNVDSLECNLQGACNPGCVEPINFAYIQTDGMPVGPPSPQLADLATFTPNSKTLLMNQGDKIRVHIFDTPAPGGGSALETVIQDLTSGASGFMQASAANGFMHTSINDCSGTPFNFEPEYSTAKVANIIPWAALQVNISTEFEIGHFIPCTSLSKPSTFSFEGFTDTYWNNCVGPYERATGPDGGKSNPEVSDATCFPQGDTHGGTTAPNIVTGCNDAFAQNGDLDFDGTSYWADWPNGTAATNFPGSFVQQPPAIASGGGYSQFQFQTDVALSESTCTGTSGCAVPPPNAPGTFYPFWTQASCAWEFGNVSSGSSFGGAAQYGSNDFATLGYPEFESQLYPNNCG